ncbi:hypothetical protein G3578_14470 [Brevibacillus sp. SYP-B805]|uniref:hypothetical protein n=1 Tax=Brevibacillus sp. SYP-B805 TaxID=1578199 RepID=UPI0013EDDF17|nr:hypothetical protein [Brevibacillus sp. SYP-B805]NGQ96365.1 hypothetical protein [Brevibacillus sp. SYP-B805]
MMEKTHGYVGRLEPVSPCWLRGNRHPRFDAQHPYSISDKIAAAKSASSTSPPRDAWTGLGQHVDIRI